MTGVARGGIDDLPTKYARRRAGRRLKRVRRIVCLYEVADLKTHPMGQGCVINHHGIGGDVLLERILVRAISVVDERAGRGGFDARLGLGCGRARHDARRTRGRRDSPVDVGVPSAG